MIQQKPPQFAVAFLRAIRFATQAPFVAFYRQRKNRAPRGRGFDNSFISLQFHSNALALLRFAREWQWLVVPFMISIHKPRYVHYRSVQ